MRWLKEHSLSLVLLFLVILQTLAFYWVDYRLHLNPDNYWLSFWSKWLVNVLGGSYGALVIVIATKYFIERGSEESK